MSEVEELLEKENGTVSPEQLEPATNQPHDERFEQLLNDEEQRDQTVYYGSNVKDSVHEVIEELDELGYDTQRVSSKKVRRMDAEDFEGPLLLRSKRGFDDEKTKRKLDMLQKQGVDILPSPKGAEAANDKLSSKQRLNRNLRRVSNASTTTTYDSADKFLKAKMTGEEIVEKPRRGSHGEGFQILQPDEEFEIDPDCIYEKKVDHWNNPDIEERRALMYVGKNEEKVVDVKTRKAKTNKEIPKNFNNGGSYIDPEFVTKNELEGALASGRAVDGGIVAVDYTLNKKTGEFKAIEPNSTVQIDGIRQYSDIDINKKTAEYIDNDLKGYSTQGLAAEHIQQKLDLPELVRESYEEFADKSD
jgi:glutathione synthase/RimK-type ligase-like ATP-grasp enzyme